MEIRYELELLRTTDGHTRKERVLVSTTVSSPKSDGKPAGDEARDSNLRPSTVADLKKKIRENFSVPECVQDLSFEGQSLSDTTVLKEALMRDGDTIRVSYIWEADCKEILEVVDWFKNVEGILKLMAEYKSNYLSGNISGSIIHGLNTNLMENLQMKYFYPWLDTRSYVNKLHFATCGGLKVMMSAFNLILRHPWEEINFLLQIIASNILHVLWNMCETLEIKRLILSHNNCLKLSLLCLMLEKVEDVVTKFGGFSVASVPNDARERMTLEAMIGALGVLCNLSELPECQMDIAAYPGCLEQLSCISVAPRVKTFHVQLVATLFFRLAHSPETHPLLAPAQILQRILDASDNEQWTLDMQYMMPRYFTQVFLSQMILVSPKHIPDELKTRIHEYMAEFFKAASYETLRETDIKHQYIWSIFTPLVKLLYIKSPNQAISKEISAPAVMNEMHMLSLKSVLLALKVMLSRDNHRELLFKEKLEDYVTCAPFYLPELLKGLGVELVKVVGSLQPPSLGNIVRSKLATIHYGLVPVLERSVHDITTDLMN